MKTMAEMGEKMKSLDKIAARHSDELLVMHNGPLYSVHGYFSYPGAPGLVSASDKEAYHAMMANYFGADGARRGVLMPGVSSAGASDTHILFPRRKTREELKQERQLEREVEMKKRGRAKEIERTLRSIREEETRALGQKKVIARQRIDAKLRMEKEVRGKLVADAELVTSQQVLSADLIGCGILLVQPRSSFRILYI